MNTNLYWIIRKRVLSLKFIAKKIWLWLWTKYDNIDHTLPMHLQVLKLIIVQLIQICFIAWLAVNADCALLDHLDKATFDMNVFRDIVLGGMGIAGVILGLYCANIASIFSAQYTNAPESLAHTFHNDVITKSCLRQIVGYIVTCVVYLFACIVDAKIYWVSVAIVLFMTIRMVITFSVAGNRTYALAITFRMADSHHNNMHTTFKKIARNNALAKDISFQNFFQKNCSKSINTLADIANYNIDIPLNQNTAMSTFACENLVSLRKYWARKSSIPYESYWYCNKAEYIQWHYAKDYEIQRAILHGTTLDIKMVRDRWWFENDLLQVNQKCTDKFFQELDYSSLQQYLANIRFVSQSACKGETEHYWLDYLDRFQEKLVLSIKQTHTSKTEKSLEILSSLCDLLCVSYIETLVGMDKEVNGWNLNFIFQTAEKMHSFTCCDFEKNVFLNNAECKRLFQHIETEYTIERKRITPEWYIEQTVAHQIYKRIANLLLPIERITKGLLKFGETMERIHTDYAAVVFSHCIELNIKCSRFVQTIENILPALEQKHLEDSVVWEEVSLVSLKDTLCSFEAQSSKHLIRCCSNVALSHWDTRGDRPDFLGFCYNYVCERLMQAIEEDNFSGFDDVYSNFLGLVILYQEYVRTSVAKRKEPYLQIAGFQKASDPFVEFAMISGLAIVWGEFVEDPKWKNCIETTVNTFFNKDQKIGMRIFEGMVAYTMEIKKHTFGIGSRSSIQTNWELRISKALMRHKKFGLTYFQYGTPVLNTSSKLLSAYCRSISNGCVHLRDAEDVFFVVCINPYLGESSQYRSFWGWERKLS